MFLPRNKNTPQEFSRFYSYLLCLVVFLYNFFCFLLFKLLYFFLFSLDLDCLIIIHPATLASYDTHTHTNTQKNS